MVSLFSLSNVWCATWSCRLSALEDLKGVLECPTIGTLDIQKNKIDDPAILDSILTKLPNLRCLYLLGNPVVKKIKYYRKTLIAKVHRAQSCSILFIN